MINFCSRGRRCGVYVHIPFCKRKCDYCAFVSTPDFSLQMPYVARLVQEVRSSGLTEVCADTIYIGGGTPSALYPGALAEIFAALRAVMDITPDAEITVEANPESCKPDFVDECLSCGVNRVSMGLQSANNAVISAVGRIHTSEEFVTAAKLLRAKGISNISSDIILGLPGQSLRDVTASVELITGLCEHASVYALNVEEHTPLCARGYRADDDVVADMYEAAVTLLKAHGFSRYEVSNFALPGMESRHNQKYWHCMPYLAFGVAAHGYDGDNIRYSHSDSIKDYIEKCEIFTEELTEKDKYNEYVMLALRTERGIDLEDFAETFGYRFENEKKVVLDSYVNRGIMSVAQGFARILPEYMFVMNGIIEDIMSD